MSKGYNHCRRDITIVENTTEKTKHSLLKGRLLKNSRLPLRSRIVDFERRGFIEVLSETFIDGDDMVPKPFIQNWYQISFIRCRCQPFATKFDSKIPVMKADVQTNDQRRNARCIVEYTY